MASTKKAELMTTTSAGEIDLFQWDIVNATTFKGVNRSVTIQDKTPKTFANQNPAAGVAKIDGDWDTWQLITGGMGNEIMMELPVKSGSATYSMLTPSYAELSPPVIDRVTQGKVTLGADKLTIEAQDIATQSAHAFSDATVKSGKIYFEVTVDRNGSGIWIGMASPSVSASSFFRDPKSIGYRSDGEVYYRGSSQIVLNRQGQRGNAAAWVNAGDTVGMAADFDRGLIWIRGADGTWQGQNSDPTTGAAPLTTFGASQNLYPLVAVSSNAKATINLGQTPFKHGLPTGFERGVKVSDTSTRTRDLAGTRITARVTLQKKDAGTNKKALMVNDQAGTTTEAVEIVSITRNGIDVVPPVKSAFNTWLNDPANLSQFDNIFHAIDYAKLASQSGKIKDTMKWIAPVYSDYAVVDIPAALPGEPDAVFAVLNQTDKSTVDRSKFVAEVSPDLMAHLSGNENAVVAISAERLTEEILLAGANGAAADGETPDFKIDSDKRVVTNGKEFKMRPTKLAQAGDTVQPIVPPDGFTMRIDGRRIKLKYEGLHFDFANKVLKQNEKVTFGYEQTMFLELEERGDGSHVLVPTFNDPLGKQPKSKGEIVNWNNVIDKWKVDMKLDPPTHDNTTLWIGLICGAEGLVVGGFAIYGIYKCVASAASDAEALGDAALQDMQANNGETSIDMPPAEPPAGMSQYGPAPQLQNQYDIVQPEVANNIYDAVDSPLQLFAMGDAETDAEEASLAAKPKETLVSSSMLYNVHWGVAFHGLRAMAGLEHVTQLNLTEEEIKKFAGNDVDVLGLETTVQNFLKTALSPFDWPETTGFDLTNATLQGALLLQGELKSATVKSSSKGAAL